MVGWIGIGTVMVCVCVRMFTWITCKFSNHVRSISCVNSNTVLTDDSNTNKNTINNNGEDHESKMNINIQIVLRASSNTIFTMVFFKHAIQPNGVDKTQATLLNDKWKWKCRGNLLKTSDPCTKFYSTRKLFSFHLCIHSYSLPYCFPTRILKTLMSFYLRLIVRDVPFWSFSTFASKICSFARASIKAKQWKKEKK